MRGTFSGAEQSFRVQSTANAIAWLDLYASFAQVAFENNYCRPDVTCPAESIFRMDVIRS